MVMKMRRNKLVWLSHSLGSSSNIYVVKYHDKGTAWETKTE